MLLRLEIAVYDIKVGLTIIPKATLDHDLHVLLTIVSLDHISLLYLVRSTEDPFVPFTPPSLYTTLV